MILCNLVVTVLFGIAYLVYLLQQKTYSGFAAGFVSVSAAALLLRAVLWLVLPEQQFLNAGWSHALLLFVALAGEAGLGVIILMLTGQRSEASLAAANSELEAVNLELLDALAEVKTLRGILPICLHCKKIRDDEGCWQRVETYVRERSDADFSHGICPECAKERYPEYDLVSKDGE